MAGDVNEEDEIREKVAELVAYKIATTKEWNRICDLYSKIKNTKNTENYEEMCLDLFRKCEALREFEVEDESAEAVNTRQPQQTIAPEHRSHNVAWSEKEQELLNFLLIKYPPEKIKSNRHRKIAAEFPTRTARQVESRIQKVETWKRKQRRQARRKQNVKKMESSKEPELGSRSKTIVSAADTSYREALARQGVYPAMLEDYVPPRVLMEGDAAGRPVSVPSARKNGNLDESDHHIGYACDGCGIEPIIGPRYECISCREAAPAGTEVSVDFCSVCHDKQVRGDTWIHLRGHRQKIHKKAVDATLLEFNYLIPEDTPGY
eukprot:Clim_evm56s207 gene=Clim_evmTU56s207